MPCNYSDRTKQTQSSHPNLSSMAGNADLPMRLKLMSQLTGESVSLLKCRIYHGELPAKRDGKFLLVRPSESLARHDRLPNVKTTNESNNQDQATQSPRNSSKAAKRHVPISGLRERTEDLRLRQKATQGC